LKTLAVVCDYAEEEWPSMELAAELVLSNRDVLASRGLAAEAVRPAMKRRLAAMPVLSRLPGAGTGDRLINRFWDYPRALAPVASRFDLFHIVDHSYGHLALGLPPGRAVITCHDLDAVRCLVEPSAEPRPAWYRRLAKRMVEGMRRAATVVCVSAATRDDLLRHRLVDEQSVVVVTNGVHPEFSEAANAAADKAADRLLGPRTHGTDELLHVGATIPRKNLEAVLSVFAVVRKARSAARLIRVGGPFTAEQEQLASRLGIRDGVVVLPYLERSVLAAVYRRAAVVLLPSWREGFGLPIAEAMACGTPVVASELPALREVGGKACEYCPPADITTWRDAVLRLLGELRDPHRWEARRRRLQARAGEFEWRRQAGRVADVYEAVLDRAGKAQL